jgi:hypothetical protein
VSLVGTQFAHYRTAARAWRTTLVKRLRSSPFGAPGPAQRERAGHPIRGLLTGFEVTRLGAATRPSP